MMRKLLILFVVVALPGLALGAQAIWKGGAAGNWETAANWSTVPESGSHTAWTFRTDGGTSVITVTSSGSAYKLYMIGAATYPPSATDATVIVSSGATLTIARDVFMYSTQTGAKSTIKIEAGGTANFATGGAYQVVLAGNVSGVRSTDKLEVYGTLNISTGTGTANALVVASTETNNGQQAIVNIYSGGIVNTTGYSIRTATTNPGHIYIQAGGWMWMNADRTTKVAADIAAGRIAPMDEATTLEYGYDAGLNKTWIHGVPEPATVALLGLGFLLVLYSKRA